MPEQQLDAEAVGKRDVRHFQEALEKLWEKARLVSEIVVRLKEENKVLKARADEMESNGNRLRSELENREQELHKIRKELLQLQSNGSNIFTKEEKEELKSRIKDLIVKINSRL